MNTYQNNSIENIKYSDITSLFQNNNYSDRIMTIINKYISDFKSKDNKLKPEIIYEMNILILENKQNRITDKLNSNR